MLSSIGLCRQQKSQMIRAMRTMELIQNNETEKNDMHSPTPIPTHESELVEVEARGIMWRKEWSNPLKRTRWCTIKLPNKCFTVAYFSCRRMSANTFTNGYVSWLPESIAVCALTRPYTSHTIFVFCSEWTKKQQYKIIASSSSSSIKSSCCCGGTTLSCCTRWRIITFHSSINTDIISLSLCMMFECELGELLETHSIVASLTEHNTEMPLERDDCCSYRIRAHNASTTSDRRRACCHGHTQFQFQLQPTECSTYISILGLYKLMDLNAIHIKHHTFYRSIAVSLCCRIVPSFHRSIDRNSILIFWKHYKCMAVAVWKCDKRRMENGEREALCVDGIPCIRGKWSVFEWKIASSPLCFCLLVLFVAVRLAFVGRHMERPAHALR